MPKVSVIIPTYNRPELIGKAIKSVLNQTFQDFEIIVVDDGTKQRAEEEVRKIYDTRIKYVQHEVNKGGGVARNTGAKNSSGDFIAFLDDDDEWLPEKLEIQVKALEKSDESVGFCFTGVLVGKKGHETSKQVYPEGINDYGEISLIRFNGFMTSSLLIRKNVFLEVGGFDKNFPSHQEPDLIIRISKKYKGIGIDKPLVKMCNISEYDHVGGSLERRIMGREMILAKYENEFEKYPEILSKHYFWLGLLYRDSGNIKEAKKNFKKSLKLKFNLRYLFHYFYLIIKIKIISEFQRSQI